MTSLEKAEHLVRNHPANKELMELGFGCEIKHKNDSELNQHRCVFLSRNDDGTIRFFAEAHEGTGHFSWVAHDELHKTGNQDGNLVILGKPPHLEHYLRVLVDCHPVAFTEEVLRVGVDGELITLDFNLTTGAPATEKDAEEFIKLVQNTPNEWRNTEMDE